MRSRIALLSALCACVAVVGGAAAETAASVQGVVISEFRVRGPNGAADEFVELYNPTAASISIGGWLIRGSNNAGTVSTRATITAGTSIPAGCHYLVGNSSTTGGPYSGSVPADQSYTTGITDDGGIGLTLADGTTVVDAAGMSTGSAYKEGTTLTSLGTSNLDRGYERKPGGASGNGQDTDDNSSDFSLVTPSNPQSSASTCISNEPTNPSGVGAASPSTVAAGGSSLLTVAVTAGANPASTGLAVTADLSTIGGSAAQQLFDDGTHGDATAGDNTFSFQATVAPGTTPGAKTLPATITDAQARSGSASIGLTVSAPATVGPGDVVISEVYGGGGNAGATYKNDFIELFNRTAAPISLAGWSVQYNSATGTGNYQVTALTGTIAAGGYFLVQEAAGAGGDLNLPGPDVIAPGAGIAMAAGAGKVALVSNTTALTGGTTGAAPLAGTGCPTNPSAIIDYVGYGSTATCSETSPTATLTNTTSAQRKGGGATDTDNNSSDFDTSGAPAPRGTTDPAPTVTSTVPASGTTDVGTSASIVVNFSEPVTPAGSWFTISCASSGSHTAAVSANAGSYQFTLNPDTDFGSLESCTVTIVAAQVSDLDTFDPPDTMAANYVFSFTTADASVCGDPATAIHTVQGSGNLSPVAGSSVAIEGIVVGDYQQAGGFGGFYVQEEDAQADADPATSEGIFVFSTLANVSTGDHVRVRGTVTEFATGTSSLTELSNVNVLQTCSTGNPLPAATNVTLPVAALSDFESYEGMRVHFSQTLTATETFTLGRFGEVRLAQGGRLYTPTAVVAPGAPANALANENLRRSFVLDDGDNQQNIDPTIHPVGGLSASNTLRSGYTTSGLDGIFDERFSTYRLQPVGPVPFTPSNPRTPAPESVGGTLRVASFNVLNFFNGNGTHQEGAAGGFPTSRGANTLFEFDRQLAKEVSALQAMNADIVGLMEIENDAQPASAVQDLVNGLNSAMGANTYSFIDTGVIGTDEIKVALIYKPASVTPVGAFKTLTSAIDPRFIDTRNRPALAQTFQQNATGEKLTVVVNHLKSKGSACTGAPLDDPDTGDGQGNCNLTRTRAAQAEADWLATDPTGSGDPDFLLIGDMNSYTFEDPITAFTNAGYTNLARHFGGLAAYSYVFDGQSGYLDHALASSSLAAQATGATDWHINADEPIALDYNVEFKTANQVNTFYAPDAYRASDHDPVVIGLNLESNRAPTVGAGGPYTVAEGGSVTVTATGNDPDGDTLTYAWDLDDDGSFETSGQSASFSAAAIDGPATRTIHVRATDPGGLSDESSATVTIQNADPSATFNAPATALAGFPFTISLTNPSDPAPADTFTYRFDCGTGYGGYGAASSASCTATSAGPVSVRGTIRDDDGGSHEYTATVNVIVTYDSLCDLTRLYVTKKKVEDDLCHELDKAEKADAKGDVRKKQEHLRHYVDKVRKESGKSLTTDQAQILIDLAGQL
jgi:uncharacterized protein